MQTTAPVEEKLLEALRALTSERQEEVVRYAEALLTIQQALQSGKGIAGILEGQGFDVSEEDVAEARREMWANFPRDID